MKWSLIVAVNRSSSNTIHHKRGREGRKAIGKQVGEVKISLLMMKKRKRRKRKKIMMMMMMVNLWKEVQQLRSAVTNANNSDEHIRHPSNQ